ncbi:PaaX family transcriptional regulator C-terminal domain-containing protein [Streptomyces sp. SID3343]|uniref:PaaX family transcriptional regulator C-terminal domain-containing protein n=1 Tax=Streptomyces sp. SID3343 TaxID=2690260 RepID=UPI00136E7AB3|nr:PaaX family transcriptional regulator C-terminal domain-containing protein [Streptomyces sp. SID3343]MYV97861.1 transcriptional regulator [Streptomyces sp. SID3343]
MPEIEPVVIPTRTLVHALVDHDGTVDTGELYTVAGTLGMTDQQVRLCVKRLVAEGAFTHEGRGRKALLSATDATRRALEPNVEFVRYAYRRDHGLEPWDGAWHLVAFAIPESARPARDALRDAILRLGGAALHGGLYVSANDWSGPVDAEAARLGVRDAVTMLTSRDLRTGAIEDPVALTARLWPLDEIAARYERLSAIVRPRLDRLTSAGADDRGGPIEPPDAVELLTIGVELAVEFGRAMEPDPLLPSELLPTPWPGTRARALAARCWSAIAAHDTTGTTRRLYRRYEDLAIPDTAAIP